MIFFWESETFFTSHIRLEFSKYYLIFKRVMRVCKILIFKKLKYLKKSTDNVLIFMFDIRSIHIII